MTGKKREYFEQMNINYVELESIDSTNTFVRSNATRLISGNNNEAYSAAIVISNAQTGGRGRQGRSFYSPNGGIYMSILIPVKTIDEKLLGITSYAALCVRKALISYCHIANKPLDPKVKWVNDVYVGDLKVCGILIEALHLADKSYLIIGIGINTTTNPRAEEAKVPDELKNKMGFVELNRDATREDIVLDIYNRLKTYSGNISDYVDELRNHSYLIGKHIKYTFDGMLFDAVVVGLDEEGHLLVCQGAELEGESGRLLALTSGEVSIVL